LDDEPERVIRKSKFAEQGQEIDLAGTTAEQRIKMMWPLTFSAWAMRGIDLRESRLRRDILREIHLREKE
jgi:hypothetical protein